MEEEECEAHSEPSVVVEIAMRGSSSGPNESWKDPRFYIIS